MPVANEDLFSKLLTSTQRGYAISVPTLSDDLPTPIRQTGLIIGDLCFRNEDDSLEPLFNIILPETHPTNCRGLPRNWSRLHLEDGDICERRLHYKADTTISDITSTVRRRNFNMSLENPLVPIAGGGVTFDLFSTSNKSAVLFLPDGGTKIDLRPKKVFRAHAAKYAKGWCRFVEEELQREIGPHGLILLTGVTKTSSWCMATVDNCGGGRSVSLNVKAVQVAGLGASYSWQWEHATSSMSSGPHRWPGEEDWRDNQTVFVTGYQIVPSLLGGPKVRPIP
ncbi:hypothetical protein R3P38DRAFT_1192644 [Favolaschia claudopus]|uniref:Uncharacterized protein n=1 Tax=Favolaschia claudopus TaxID=2862362 RepID=A0AAW0E366_9AGAR